MGKPLKQMSDDELMAVHQEEVGLHELSDKDLLALHQKEVGTQEPIGPVETFGKQALDVASLGYGPNVIAGVKTGFGSIGDYPKERDIQRGQLERGGAENPSAKRWGTGTGIIGSLAGMAFAPELGIGAIGEAVPAAGRLAESYPTLSKIGKAFTIGTGMSAATNPGDVEGKVSGLQIPERASRALTDAPLNMLLAGAGGVVSSKLEKLGASKDLETVRALGTKDLGQITAKSVEGRSVNQSSQIADFARRNGILEGANDSTSVYKNAVKAKERAGQAIGSFFAKNNKNLTSTSGDLIYNPNDLEKTIMVDQEGNKRLGSTVIDKINEITQGVMENNENGLIDLSGLHKIKQRIQDQVTNWKKVQAISPTVESSAAQKMWASASGYFDNLLINKANEVGGNLGAELKILNKNYNLSNTVHDLAFDTMSKEQASSRGANVLTDIINSATSAATGKPSKMLGSPYLNQSIANSPYLGAAKFAAEKVPMRASQAMMPQPGVMPPQTIEMPSKIDQGTQMGFQALQMGMPAMMVDTKVKNEPSLKPTEAAQIRNNLRKGAQ